MNIPNYITLFRLLLTPFFFTVLVSYVPGKEYYRWAALGLFVTASLTDALDGFLARVWKKRTMLGKFLDPLADKMLLVSGYLGLLFVHTLPYRPPLWITVTIVFRDVIIILGLVSIFLISGKLRVQPNGLGKCTTAFQMLTLVFILLEWPPAVFSYYATAILTILSCLVYMFREVRLLRTSDSVL